MRRIAEREAAEDAIALHRVQLAADSMPNIIEQRGQGLPNARRIVAVPAAMREPGENARTQKTLAINDEVVAMRTDVAQAVGHLAERCRDVERLAPPPPGNWNDLVDRRMQGNQRRE